MKSADKISAAIKAADKSDAHRTTSVASYPETIVETVAFHHLHRVLPAKDALRSFQRLSEEFVDWNEVRVSTIKEIRQQIADGPDSLDTAVFIKDFLEHVFRERHSVDLEPLREANITDVRRALKPVRGIDLATIELVLLRVKSHPVLPLNPEMEALVDASGLVKTGDTRDRKAKALFEKCASERVLLVHHYLLDLSRAIGPIEDGTFSGAKTQLKSALTAQIKGSGKRSSGGTKPKSKKPSAV